MAKPGKPICLIVESVPDPTRERLSLLGRIFDQVISPAVESLGMLPTRLPSFAGPTDERFHAHRDQLLLGDFVIAATADSRLDPGLAYFLGLRSGLRPNRTLLVQLDASPEVPLPADLPAIRLALDESNDEPLEDLRALVAPELSRLVSLDSMSAPTPNMVELLSSYRSKDIARLKTDSFRARVGPLERAQRELEQFRGQPKAEALAGLQGFEKGLGPLETTPSAVLVDLFLSYRAVSGWHDMLRLSAELPPAVQRSVLIREQTAFALNRLGRRERALRLLAEVEEEQGPSSETCGLMGRVYKDLWKEAETADAAEAAQRYLGHAIEAYIRGFASDWRDAYPGVNAITLLTIRGDHQSRQRCQRLLPIVRFAVERRVQDGEPDYWDYATLLELAVIADDEVAAQGHLQAALAVLRETWEAESTAANLRLLRDAKRRDGVDASWVDRLVSNLVDASSGS